MNNISSKVKLPKYGHNMQMEYNVFTRENSSINGISYENKILVVNIEF